MAYKRLGELLVAAGTITEQELERGLALQKGTKDRLGTVLIANNIITEEKLIEALQMQLGIEYIDLSKINIPTELAQALPKNIAKQYQVVPVRVVKDELYLAMSDPMNFYAIEEVRKAVRKKIVPMVATASAVERAIQVLYGNEGAAKAIEEMKREAAASGEVTAVQDTAFVSTQLGDDGAVSAPTIRLVNSIIERAINERASDIHLEPRENEMEIRMRIDGMMRHILTVPRDLQSSVISRIKIMASLDIAERRVPQDGRFNVRVRDKDVDLRISTLPTVYGEKIVARLLDKSGGKLSKDAIGLTGADLEKYTRILKCRSGVILIVGPTGSGKSTTMYTMIDDLNQETVNLVTLEDPVEYNVDGVNQVQINEKVGMTFASGLRAILRQDPDIIAVGEIRDGETADIAVKSALTGHLVLSTLHTNGAAGVLTRLVNIGIAPYLVASTLRLSIAQRLVRTPCPHCVRKRRPTPAECEEFNWDADHAELLIPEPTGCDFCGGKGYAGRTALYEMIPIDHELRKMILKNADEQDFEQYAFMRSGLPSLHADGAAKILAGLTTIQEVRNVTNSNGGR